MISEGVVEDRSGIRCSVVSEGKLPNEFSARRSRPESSYSVRWRRPLILRL